MPFLVKFLYDGKTLYIGRTFGGPAESTDMAYRFTEKHQAEAAAERLKGTLWCHYGSPEVVPA